MDFERLKQLFIKLLEETNSIMLYEIGQDIFESGIIKQIGITKKEISFLNIEFETFKSLNIGYNGIWRIKEGKK